MPKFEPNGMDDILVSPVPGDRMAVFPEPNIDATPISEWVTVLEGATEVELTVLQDCSLATCVANRASDGSIMYFQSLAVRSVRKDDTVVLDLMESANNGQ